MIIPNEADMARLGAAIAAALQPGEAVCLSGPLGAGKSSLARALIRALTTSDQEAPSPTFTLVQFYVGARIKVAHFDLYRLTRADEAYEIGLDEGTGRRRCLLVRGGQGADQSAGQARFPRPQWTRQAHRLARL